LTNSKALKGRVESKTLTAGIGLEALTAGIEPELRVRSNSNYPPVSLSINSGDDPD
jgi:hypothetical protein